MKYFLVLLGMQGCISFASANPAYHCDIEYVKKGTIEVISTKGLDIDYQGFRESCESGKCFKQSYVVGGEQGDPEIIALISHNAKMPIIGTMLMAFTLGKDGNYTQTSLAGTDFGNRLYTQVSTQDPNVDLYVNCSFVK
jgi:hypothetical protein